jgi:hypothetical protein
MAARRGKPPFAACMLASLAMHAVIVLPLMSARVTPDVGTIVAAAQLRLEDLASLMSIEEQPPELRLGIEAPTPPSLTWVGYETYEEHRTASEAEMDQAAFRQDPAGGSDSAAERSPGDALAGRVPAAAPSALAQSPPLEPDAPAAQAPDEPPPAPADADSPDAPHDPAAIDLLLAFNRFVHDAAAAAADPATRSAAPQEARHADDTQAAPPPDAHAAGPQPDARAAPASPAPPANPNGQDSTAGSAGAAGPPAPGESADKESDPASVIAVDFEDVRLGRPLAGHGLELRPQKPEFTPLVRITSAPGNPLVEIRFGRSGRPLEARIIGSSGDNRVDEALLSSLYRWRARGSDLERLQGDRTIDVRLRIILNPRAA